MNAASRRVARSRPRPRIEALEARQLLSGSGTLDHSFGSGSGFTLGAGVAGSMAVQPDGKIVVDGIETQAGISYLTVARFESDGAPDTTFGVNGQEILAQSPSPIDAGVGVAAGKVFILPDGQILVTGQDTAASTAANQVVPTTIDRDAVFRLNSDGTPDATFGTDGEVAYAEDANPRFPHLSAAALEPDGQIVLAGVSGAFFPNDSGPQLVAVARLNADGSLDATFGQGGIASTAVVINGNQTATVNAVAVQSDGKVVVAGSAISQFGANPLDSINNSEGFAARFDADGTTDSTFGGTSGAGIVLIPPDPANPGMLGQSAETGLAIQPDGKIVLGGSYAPTNTGSLANVTRLEPDGTFDLTFGTGGQAFVPGDFTGNPGALVLQADGKIILTGSDFPTTTLSTQITVALLVRFNADGSLDSSFGNTSTPGVSTFSLGGSFQPDSVAVQPNGRIVLDGIETSLSATSPTTEFAIARVLAAPTPTADQEPAADYDASGKSDLAIYLPSPAEFVYRPTTPGAADVFVPFGLAGAGQTLPAPGDYDGSGQTEIAAYLPALGLYAYRPADGAPDVVEPFGIPGIGQDIPAPGDYTGTGKDDLAIYLPSIGAFAIRPAGGGPDEIIPFGLAGAGQSIPVPGDYDGSGKTEIAVYMPSLAEFAYRPANGGPDVIVPFGLAGSGQTLPAPGDYDGSGKTEIAAYLPSLGLFAYRPGNGGADVIEPFGAANDGTVPVPGDYDGSGHDDIAIFDPTTAVFAYRPSSGPDVLASFGVAGVGQTVPAAASPSLAASGTLSARSVAPGSASPASSGPAVPSGPLGPAPRRVSRGTVVAQSGTDLAGRPAS